MDDLNVETITFNSYQSTKAVDTYYRQNIKPLEHFLINKYFVSPGSVLDIGCGTGRTSFYLRDIGHTVTAIDYSKNMIKRANTRKRDKLLKFMVMNANKLSFQSGVFDYVIFSFNGLDYLYPDSDRKKALAEVYRVLKPGGIFIFSSHNATFIPNTRERVKKLIKTILKQEIYPYRWDFQEFGQLITHYITIWGEMNEIKNTGFTKVKIFSNYSTQPLIIAIADPYPSYICFKPV